MTVTSEFRGKLARQARMLNMRNSRGRHLPALVLMTDDTRSADWGESVRALPRGSAVVVRHRDARARELLARALKPICRKGGVRLLIAADEALAVRTGADGVHLPQAQLARLSGIRKRHPRWLVTCAAHDAGAVRRTNGAHAVFVAPVFMTASHAGKSGLGPVRLAALTGRAGAVYALGGIDEKTIRRLGAHRIVGIGLIGGWTRS